MKSKDQLKDYRAKSDAELGEELLKLRREQFNLRMQAAAGHGAKPDQHGKVRKVGDWLAARGRTWDDTITICYGDSINDLPLLERATHPVVTNGDARLIAIAHERGWQTLQLFGAAHVAGAA